MSLPISLIFCLPAILNILPHFLSFYFVLPLHLLLPVSPYSFHLYGSTSTSLSSLLLSFSTFCFSPNVWIFLIFFLLQYLSFVSLVPCLTLPFLPAVLSGVFQTFGACQETPGLARLSPPFIPIRSHTGTQSSVSSQQQLQED